MMRKIVLTLLMLGLSVRAECADWTSYFRFEWPEWLTWKTEASTDPVSDNWDNLTDKLGRTLELRDKQETLPKTSWIPFRDNQKRNAERINALLDEAVNILMNSEAHEIRKNAAELRDTLTKQRTELDSLRNKRITAPEKSSLPWVMTKAKADEKIARLQEEIVDTERRLTADIGTFPERLKPISRNPHLTDLDTAINYNEIFEQLQMLHLAIYAPSAFILPSQLWKYKEEESTTGHRLSIEEREQGIQRLMNMQLLKRLESSVNSFRLTLTRIRDYMQETLDAIARFQNGERRVSVDDYESVDGDEDEQDFTIGKKKNRILLEDMDYISWQKEIKDDLEIIRLLLFMLQSITPEHDSKLQQLITDLKDKFAHPINGNNKKVIIFTAFSDTALYLYDCLAEKIKSKYNLNVALVTGDVEARSTLKLRENLDFNKVLTLFSPISKECEAIYPHLREDIDVLIATDCISEGQNLQDCDYLLNYDIHWNPVRIIQRFGRIDRIGSLNAQIQLVNYWPDMTLDEYINLKGRVESRMKATVLTATGDDNLLSPEEKDDLEYRRQQLERLKEDVVDLEEMNSGVSIMDLGLNEFRLDLLEYMQGNHDVEHTPFGLHAVVRGNGQAPAGTIFVLKNRTAGVNIDHKNQLHPFYMVYIRDDGEVQVDHLHPKDLLDKMRLICKPMSKPDVELCHAFNKETRDGLRMGKYSDLLSKAINSIISVKEQSNIDSFLEGFVGELFEERYVGLDDFELICFLVIK